MLAGGTVAAGVTSGARSEGESRWRSGRPVRYTPGVDRPLPRPTPLARPVWWLAGMPFATLLAEARHFD